MNDNERRSITITLYVFLSMALLASVGILISGLVTTAAYAPTTQRTALIAMGLCLLLLGLTRARQFWIPRLALPALSYLIATYLVLINFGVRDTTVSLFPVSIALAGLLLGRAGLITLALLSVVTLFGVGYAEYSGRLVTTFSQYTSMVTVVTAPTLLALTSLMIYLMADYLQRSLAQTRQNEKALAEQNQQLNSYRTTLETQVTERTHAAEAARQQAETAHLALEVQMWQVSGQARLNETLRGEQTIAALSSNVVNFLCDYLELPVGAVFVAQEGGLQFSGGHAYLPDDPAATRFAPGAGLVGQVAVEKRLLVLADLPAGQLTIPTGLGIIIPQAVLLLPLVHGDVTVGVIELGALQAFSPAQIKFLEQSAEGIAIALYTAQTRLRFAELLEETQRQAEELRAQEEELRAANEGLLAQAEG